MNRKKVIYWHELPGHNFRLTNLQAALGVAQLEKRDEIIKQRERVYNTYLKFLDNQHGLFLQQIGNEVQPIVWAVAMKLDPMYFPQGRDAVMKDLAELGIETRPGFFSSNLLDIYEKHELPVCEEISKNVISVPSFPTLTNQEIEFICTSLLNQKK